MYFSLFFENLPWTQLGYFLEHWLDSWDKLFDREFSESLNLEPRRLRTCMAVYILWIILWIFEAVTIITFQIIFQTPTAQMTHFPHNFICNTAPHLPSLPPLPPCIHPSHIHTPISHHPQTHVPNFVPNFSHFAPGFLPPSFLPPSHPVPVQYPLNPMHNQLPIQYVYVPIFWSSLIKSDWTQLANIYIFSKITAIHTYIHRNWLGMW